MGTTLRLEDTYAAKHKNNFLFPLQQLREGTANGLKNTFGQKKTSHS